MKRLFFILAVAMLGFVSAGTDSSFKVSVDLTKESKLSPLTVKVPESAQKLFRRYEQLIPASAPLLVGRGFAPSLKGKGVDKGVEWIASVNAKRNTLILQTANFSKQDRTIELSLSGSNRQMLSPVYRRVLPSDRKGAWKRMAWETPRNPGVSPWTVEVPANTVQTVLVRLKEVNK